MIICWTREVPYTCTDHEVYAATTKWTSFYRATHIECICIARQMLWSSVCCRRWNGWTHSQADAGWESIGTRINYHL